MQVDADYDPLAYIMSENGEIVEDVAPAANGSWSITASFPEDTPAGEILMVAGCDQAYMDGFAYQEWTMTVGKAAGAVRGVEANTPGTKSVTTDKTTTSSAPGQKVVRVIAGFQPHEWVTLTMHSTPTVVGKFQADANGVVTAEFTLPAVPLPAPTPSSTRATRAPTSRSRSPSPPAARSSPTPAPT